MEEKDKASYEASSFAVDASKIEFDKNGAPIIEDFPAFVHEWWHYIQDVSTITGQNGFYLWMRDIVRMTSITCDGESNRISIPLNRDAYDEVYDKYRRLYNIFCGKKEERALDHPMLNDEPRIISNAIRIDGEERSFAKCEITINNQTFYFGLIALQEINAFYAQKIVENYNKGVAYRVPTDSLPEFPYKMGDILFDFYSIECDVQTRFAITTIVLDTLQAPAVFLMLLKDLKGRQINYFKHKIMIMELFNKNVKACSCPNLDAINEWFKDYNNWLRDESHMMLRESLSWYISIVNSIETLKKEYGDDAIAIPLLSGQYKLNRFYSLFPAPLIKYNGKILGQTIKGDKNLSTAAQKSFENALVIWSHRRIYDLLRSRSKEEFIKNSRCPLYNEGKCLYLCQYKIGKAYDCSTAPWLVVKGEKHALCPYAIAAHSMGLWQNDLDINF